MDSLYSEMGLLLAIVLTLRIVYLLFWLGSLMGTSKSTCSNWEVKSLSRVRLWHLDCSPPGSSVHGFSRHKYWSGVPLPSPGDLPVPGIEPRPPALQADVLPSKPPGAHRFPDENQCFLFQGWNCHLYNCLLGDPGFSQDVSWFSPQSEASLSWTPIMTSELFFPICPVSSSFCCTHSQTDPYKKKSVRSHPYLKPPPPHFPKGKFQILNRPKDPQDSSIVCPINTVLYHLPWVSKVTLALF